MSDQQRMTPDDARKANEQCHGAPRYFTYPRDVAISDEERKRYEEFSAKLHKTKR